MPSLKHNKNPAFKHGEAQRHSKRRNIYRRWQHIIQRCYNPNDRDYPRYGGLGVGVCDRWRNSFIDFVSDVGEPANKYWSLDRIDPDGHYSPGNCRWATAKQQANNRRNTVKLTIRGITRPLSDWCRLVGIGSKTVLYRLKKGMPHEDAIYMPLKRKKGEQNE